MRSIFQLLITLLLLSASYPVSATTYTYAGQPLLQGFPCGYCATVPGLTGSVTFDFNTTNFTGRLSLVPGDTASLVAPSGSSGGASYPPPTLPPSVPLYYVPQLSGTFTLTNGAITDWFVDTFIG